MLPVKRPFNANIRSVSTKIDETIEFLRLYEEHHNLDELRNEVVEKNAFHLDNLRTIKNIFTTFKARYGLNSEWLNIKNLTDVVSVGLSEETIRLIIFLYFAQYEYALFEVMTELIYPLKVDKYNKINGSTVLSFLDGKKGEHPEYNTWTKNSREIFSSVMLTSAKDFGFLEKKSNKEYLILNRLLPIEVIGYLLYYLNEHEIPDILNSIYLRLYLITPEEFKFYINELSRMGYIDYSYKNENIVLQFKFKTLDEYINHIKVGE